MRHGTSRWLGLALPLGSALLASCNEYDIARMEREDFFTQVPASEVDILLVVDNSCSMQPYQQELARNFEHFLTYFEEGDVDYRIGVLTTTVTPVEYISGVTCSPNQLAQIPEGGRLVKDTWIDRDTPKGADKFSQLVRVGVCGSGYEMGIESAALALSGRLKSGFLRNDAALSLIFVSDEQDVSPWPVNDYINAFRSVKGPENPDKFNASALVVTDPSECTPSQLSAGGGTAGTRYMDVARQNGGILGNICEDSFHRVVTELSLATSRLRDTFHLKEYPSVPSLTVLVNGEEIPCEDGAWQYKEVEYEGEEDVPAIVFHRKHMPKPQSEILVRYNGGGGGEHTCGDEEA